MDNSSASARGATSGGRLARAVWFAGPRTVACRSEQLPALGSEDVRVRTIVSGLSHGTEMLVYRGYVAGDLKLDLPALQGSFSFPSKYGYANVGEVVECGEAVSSLALGDVVFVHGIHLAVLALSRTGENVHLDIVGEERATLYARATRELVRRHKLEARVHVYAAVEGDLLTERYARANAFLLPSRSEGFGTAFAEALSFGLPVIGCKVGPLPWLVPEECGTLVPVANVKALSVAMAAVAGDSALLASMNAAALKRSRELPTRNDTIRRFSEVILELLSRSPPGRGFLRRMAL